MAGILHWEEKRFISCSLLSAVTDKELVDAVYPDDSVLAGKVIDSFRKWKNHSPTKVTGPKKFFDDLAICLECDKSVTGAMLISSSLDRFIQYLPDKRKARALEIVRDNGWQLTHQNAQTARPAESLDRVAPTLNPKTLYLLHPRGPVESIATGFEAGTIDQRHYYLTPETAESWNRLVRAEAYPTYDHCKAGLRALVESKLWMQALESTTPRTAVMLAGGGSPTKDMVILRSLLSQPSLTSETVNYYLVDISFYMLRYSLWWLEDHLQTLQGHERVKVLAVYGDVLADLHEELHPEFHKHGPAVFGITGGTIGNFSEFAFFKSLERVSSDGDLLIVSAESVDGSEGGEIEKALKRKYDHSDMRSFIAPVVGAVLGEAETGEPLKDALKNIEVTVSSGEMSSKSDVPGSWCVTLNLTVDGRKITLVTSTRYSSTKFIAYAQRLGWHLVCCSPSPLNPHYMQFCFRRKATAQM